MTVVRIEKKQAAEFVKKKHYSHSEPIFWAGFGLEENGMISGVAVYGQPSPQIQKCAFHERDFRLYELSRVVIQSKTRNAASFLVANSLKMLEPRPCAVVSYADTEHSHCGIIYQATNWIYTGSTKSHDSTYLVDGKRMHSMSLRQKGITDPVRWARGNGVEMVPPMEKHRYFYICGSKNERRGILEKLAYPIVSQYPKCNQQRYDDGPEIIMSAVDDQYELFQ